MVRGVISGYWEIGRLNMQTSPSSVVTMAITAAIAGCLMKNALMAYLAVTEGVVETGAV